jgi:ABC-2 type transport system permease protein
MGLRTRSTTCIKLLGYLLVVVLINIAGTTLFFRVDLTQDGIYSISKASKEVVSTLSEPLTINVFFTRNLPPPHNNTERYLHDLLEEYSVYANRHFNYQFYDVSPEEGDISREAKENQELATNYGIFPVQIRAIQKDEVTFQKAYMGLVLIHGDLIERIPTITTTEGLEYALTMAIQKLHNKISALLGLPQKIKLTLFLSSSLKAVAPYMQLGDLSGLPEKTKGIAEMVSAKNYGKLEFTYLDPSTDKGIDEAASKYNLLNLKWPELSDGKVPAGQGVVGLVMEYGDRVLEIPVIRVTRVPFIGTHYELVDMKRMEEIINENIESLIEINEDIGYLADHGTLKLSGGSAPDSRRDSLSTFRNLLSQGYTIQNISLKDGPIPESINCLVLARPTEKFSDYDLFQIDQFLMRGKHLALFLDRFNELLPSEDRKRLSGEVQYVPIKTGLEKLLEHYGIGIRNSYVLDEHCYKQQLSSRHGGGERPIYFVPVIKNESINKDLVFMKNIKGLVVMKISPLEIYSDRIAGNGLKAYRLFASSERSWETGGSINLDPLFTRPPKGKEKLKSFPLAYILEGEFPSYFAGNPLPEKSSSKEESEEGQGKQGSSDKPVVDLSMIESEGKIIAKGKPGKILLIGSSEMLRDNLLDEQGKSPNATFVLNVLDYLNNREGIAELRSKEQGFNPLIAVKGATKTFVKSFNIAGLPILVILSGLLVWLLRHSRKKRIHMMFQK